jgi:hypothetical protein
MVVAEEGMRHACGGDAQFEQAMMRAESVIENQVFIADFYGVSRAHAAQGRGGSAGT